MVILRVKYEHHFRELLEKKERETNLQRTNYFGNLIKYTSVIKRVISREL